MDGGAFYKVQRRPGRYGSGSRATIFRIILAEARTASFLFDHHQPPQQRPLRGHGDRGREHGLLRCRPASQGQRLRALQQLATTDTTSAFQPGQRRFRGVHDSISIERSPTAERDPSPSILINRAGDAYSPASTRTPRASSPPTRPNTNDQRRRRAALHGAAHGERTSTGYYWDEDESRAPCSTTNCSTTPTAPTVDAEGLKIGNPYNHTGGRYDLTDRGTDKEPYRWGFQIRSARGRDDYSQMVALNQAMGNLNGRPRCGTALDPIIDVDQWMRTFAMMWGSTAPTTSSGGIYPHNWRFYVRPTDGQASSPYQWDMDRTRSTSSSSSSIPPYARQRRQAVLASPNSAGSSTATSDDLIETAFNSDLWHTSWASAPHQRHRCEQPERAGELRHQPRELRPGSAARGRHLRHHHQRRRRFLRGRQRRPASRATPGSTCSNMRGQRRARRRCRVDRRRQRGEIDRADRRSAPNALDDLRDTTTAASEVASDTITDHQHQPGRRRQREQHDHQRTALPPRGSERRRDRAPVSTDAGPVRVRRADQHRGDRHRPHRR